MIWLIQLPYVAKNHKDNNNFNNTLIYVICSYVELISLPRLRVVFNLCVQVCIKSAKPPISWSCNLKHLNHLLSSLFSLPYIQSVTNLEIPFQNILSVIYTYIPFPSSFASCFTHTHTHTQLKIQSFAHPSWSYPEFIFSLHINSLLHIALCS